MLTHIHIKHFAIVQSLTLDFENGLQVLTGETGAGKSIWVDALQIGLGERADATVIYENETQCDITLCFDLSNLPKAQHWLTAHELATTDECIIRRIIHRNKPSRTSINGTPMPQHLVREFSHLLLCIHSQHQHQRLLKPAQQRFLLDQYANNEQLIHQIKTYYNDWKALEDKLTQLKLQAKTKSANLALWEYQLTEIQDLALEENEFQTTFSQFQQLHSTKNTMNALNESLRLLNDDNELNASSLLQQALKTLKMIKTPDETITQIQQTLESANIQLEEATASLANYCGNIEFQLTQLDDMENRLQEIQDIARKHHVEPEQLPNIEQQLEEQLDALKNIDQEIEQIIKAQNTIQTDYQNIAAKLTAQRMKASKKMGQAISKHMQSLGMTGGVCEVVCESLPAGVHPFGNENIVFSVATNPGQTPHPLSQTVSGGELSRLSLICHVLTAQIKDTPTLIFDEVDVGIGGKTADTVGQLLRELGEQTQILCITHLPQVAANGHHHFKAEKHSTKQQSVTTIKQLSPGERTQEIARMLSGATITEKSLSHANELLAIHS